ncbi:hypothetical protein COD17_08665 [Bacillus thuringiensis]|nr:hypothetical protein COD17_08665 [Bacillus thuringiensis]
MRIKSYNDYYFQVIKTKCEELGVPKELYTAWLMEGKENNIGGLLNEFPFRLQKFEKGTSETGVIAIRFDSNGEPILLWEYRKFGDIDGKFHAIEGQRKYINVEELESYIGKGYKWTDTLNPPICIGFSLAEKGIWHSTYEDLK